MLSPRRRWTAVPGRGHALLLRRERTDHTQAVDHLCMRWMLILARPDS
jgi:hypothetical protein